MSEIQLAHFSWGETPDRSRIHDVAIREARTASEHRMGDQPALPRATFVQRLGSAARLRFAGAGVATIAPDACSCAA